MMKFLKTTVKRIVTRLGFNLEVLNPYNNESHHLKLAIKHLGINHVIDVGANRGQFSTALIQSGYDGTIISIEPLSSAHKILRGRAAQYKNWRIFDRCALGAKTGSSTINIAGNLDSSSILPMSEKHLSSAPTSRYVGLESCKVYSLDDVQSKLNPTNCNALLKIDCQGYEYEILVGAEDSLKNIKAILVEVSLVECYVGQKLWQDIIKHLSNRNYTIFAVKKGFTDSITGETLQLDMIFKKNTEK